jgi:hypothetical protein
MPNDNVMNLKRIAVIVAGVVVGAIVGYAYYYWVGCDSGSCPITSQPVNSSLYDAVMGGTLFSMFRKK